MVRTGKWWSLMGILVWFGTSHCQPLWSELTDTLEARSPGVVEALGEMVRKMGATKFLKQDSTQWSGSLEIRSTNRDRWPFLHSSRGSWSSPQEANTIMSPTAKHTEPGPPPAHPGWSSLRCLITTNGQRPLKTSCVPQERMQVAGPRCSRRARPHSVLSVSKDLSRTGNKSLKGRRKYIYTEAIWITPGQAWSRLSWPGDGAKQGNLENAQKKGPHTRQGKAPWGTEAGESDRRQAGLQPPLIRGIYTWPLWRWGTLYRLSAEGKPASSSWCTHMALILCLERAQDYIHMTLFA